MFKLVAIGGKLRGEEYSLEDGEHTFGRDSSCDYPLQVEGVSKNHFRITINGNSAFIEDLGSSNGTFVNSELVKSATIKKTDQIAVPNVIFQLVQIKEKKVLVEKETEEVEDRITDEIPPVPKAFPLKILHFFKYKIMPAIHGINEEYEWKAMVAAIFTVYIVISIALTIAPVLQDSGKILLHEIALRGKSYAQQIERMNARALERRNLDRVNTAFLKEEEGVSDYVLFDLDGRIVSPATRQNAYINDSFYINAKEWVLKKEKGEILTTRIGGGEIGIAKGIVAFDVERGSQETVGIIAIKFSPASMALEAAKNSQAYLEALSTSILIAIVFYGFIYFLTIKPLETFRFEIEEVLRGKKKEVEIKYKFMEINGLKSSVNNILQKVRELQDDSSGEFAELEDDSGYVSTLNEILRGCPGPGMILNSEKLVQFVNSEAEDATGIRESAAQGVNIMDVARDQGFAATVIDLCDQSANNGGVGQEGSYELSGIDYVVHVASLIGKDGFAKAFYVTFVKDS